MVTGGNNQTTLTGLAFRTPLQVKITDGNGNPIAGVTVTWTAPTSGVGGHFSNGSTSITVTTNVSASPAPPSPLT